MKVLIVDDEKNLLEMVQLCWQSERMEVTLGAQRRMNRPMWAIMSSRSSI